MSGWHGVFRGGKCQRPRKQPAFHGLVGFKHIQGVVPSYIWAFPEMGVPRNHPFWGISISGKSRLWSLSWWTCHHLVLIVPRERLAALRRLKDLAPAWPVVPSSLGSPWSAGGVFWQRASVWSLELQEQLYATWVPTWCSTACLGLWSRTWHQHVLCQVRKKQGFHLLPAADQHTDQWEWENTSYFICYWQWYSTQKAS